jgi:glyoxylase-like metal-dependent hydrolase (beta-lactamase superfamily II)
MTREDYHRLSLGSYGPEDENVAYWLPDSGILIDPGPPTDEFWGRLVEGLSAAGSDVDDVRTVLVTHWHVDHAGLAPRVADAADATLAMHGDDAPFVGDYESAREERLRRDESALRRWGVPEDGVTAVIAGDAPSDMPAECDVRTVTDGERVGPLSVLHTPGHTAGHAAFVLDDHAFVGDAVLSSYTPNYGGSDTRMTDPLAAFHESLTRIETAADTASPGHGQIADLEARIRTLRAHWQQRAEAVLGSVPVETTVTPWEVARELFGEMAGPHVKLGAGEAAAQLIRLEALDLVTEVRPSAYRARPEADLDSLVPHHEDHSDT